MSESLRVTSSEFNNQLMAGVSAAYLWRHVAGADFDHCRLFNEKFNARLERTLSSRRVAWIQGGETGYGVLLPDLIPIDELADDDWYIYGVEMETLMRFSRTQRLRWEMLLLPDSVEDWVELLRQAVRSHIFNLKYEIIPDYTNVLGEDEVDPTGWLIRIQAAAADGVHLPEFIAPGWSSTPEGAARDASRRWLSEAVGVELI